MQHELESLESDIDAKKLQRKILDKKILNAIQRQEILQVEVEEEKLKRDSLSIEMIDLQQGIQLQMYKFIYSGLEI